MDQIKGFTPAPTALRIRCVSSRKNLFRWDLRVCGLWSSIRTTVQKVNFWSTPGVSI